MIIIRLAQLIYFNDRNVKVTFLFVCFQQVEYMSGLDVVWEVRSFYIFSSFRLRGIYYRPITHFIKLTILIIYAATFQSIMAQAICMAVLLTLLGLVALLVRPFRVTAFNIMLVLGIMCLAGDAIFGTVITQFSPIEVSFKSVLDTLL